MNIKISLRNRVATAYDGNKILKQKQLEPEKLKELMADLSNKSEVNIDFLRLLTKKFRVNSFDFKIKG